MHVARGALANAIRKVGLSCTDNVQRDAGRIATLLLEAVDSDVECGEASCATCYPADVPRITREQLADLLRGFRLTVDQGGSAITGSVRDPDEVASAVFGRLSADQAHEDGPEEEGCRFGGRRCLIPCACTRRDEAGAADPEVHAMAVVVAALDGLDDLACHRVCNWLADRYGIA